MRIEDVKQTVGGQPVRIYATDGGIHSSNIHGAVWRSGWQFQVWKSTGRAAFPITESVYDLDLHDWRDEIPWSCLRDGIEKVKRFECVGWVGFDRYYGKQYSLRAVKMPEGPADWRKAIAKRPRSATNNQRG